MALKTLERLFNQQADRVGPCPLPDPKTRGKGKIEHIGLIHIEPQPKNYDYDGDSNDAEIQGFEDKMWKKFKKGELTNNDGTPMTSEQLEKLLKELKK